MSGRKHWSVLRWCQVGGVLIPGLGTAGVFGYFFWILPHQQGIADFPNVPDLLLIHTILPTIVIVRFFGFSDYGFGTPDGGLALMPALLSVLINSILGLVFGTLVGMIIKCGSAKKMTNYENG